MSVKYPVGYGTETLTMDELKARYSAKMHPEWARRFFHFIESKNGLLGVGSAWRVKPHPVSAASRAGRSFHQYQRIDGKDWSTAVDLVAYNAGGVHRAPRWSEVPRQGSAESRNIGVHCNISSETWHIQPIELDGYSTWEAQGRPGLFLNYPLPGIPVPPPVDPAPGIPPFFPEQGQFSLWPLNKNKVRLAQSDFVKERIDSGFDNWTDRGEAVRYLQGVILHKAGGNITVDGHYGQATAKRVMDLQQWFKLDIDGLTGPQVWQLVDALALV